MVRDGPGREGVGRRAEGERKGGIGFAGGQNGERRRSDGAKPAASDDMTTATGADPRGAAPAETARPTAGPADGHDPDDAISGRVAKDVEQGISDIRAGRTYTTNQVKEMLGL